MLGTAADVLDQGQIVNRLSIAITAIAIAVLLLPVFPASRATVPVAAAVAVLGLIELALAMRVGLDAQLFRRIANDAAIERLDIGAFDAALTGLGLMRPSRAGRPIAKRFAGSKLLLITQSVLLFVQVAVAIAGGWSIFFTVS